MTSKLKYTKMLLFGFILFSVTACAPAISRGGSATETVQMDDSDSGAAGLTISSLELIWPETVPPDPCQETFPAPEIYFCIQNQGSAAKAPELAFISLPAGLVPGALEQALTSLPGGSWMQPETIIVTGLPGVSGKTKGIMLENKYPENFGGIHKVIFISKPPDTSKGTGGSSILITVFPYAEGAGSVASGVALGLPDSMDTGQEMGIIIEVNSETDDIPELYTIDIDPLPAISSEGKLSGSLWGENIFEDGIFHDGVSQKFIPFLGPSPDDGLVGIVWGGIVWGGAAQEDEMNGTVLTGFPPDFDFGNMMPKMGYSGSDSIPYIFGSIQMQHFDFPAELGPGENSCITIPLILPDLSGVDTMVPMDLAQFAINGSSPDTSEIDFLGLTIQAGKGNDDTLMKIVDLPTLPDTHCEPVPETATIVPIPATPAPTRKVAPPPPTPTTRTGLPTKAPGVRSAPTKTPAPPSRNN